MEPASIRYKNPGAMWGRTGLRPSAERVAETNAPIPKKWGSTQTVYLSDGLGQGNNIAVFDTWVQGICAQLDLWRTSARYRNKRFEDAIRVWSGGNNVESYIAYVTARVPGMTRNTMMDDKFWQSPMALAFLKAQAGHEAGKPIPAPDADWIEAQRRVFIGPVQSQPTSTTTKAGGSVVAGGAAAGAAHQAGLGVGWIVAIGVAVAVAAFLIWRFKK